MTNFIDELPFPKVESYNSTSFSRALSKDGDLGVPVPSRVLIGLNEAHRDLLDPKRGVSKATFEAGLLQQKNPDAINTLILNNLEAWNKLMNNEFCRKMASGTASLDGFRYYMIQVLFYLRNYVRGKLARYLSLSYQDWDLLKGLGADLQKDTNFAASQLQTCINLGVSGDIVETTKGATALTSYVNWQNEIMKEEDWINLHIMVVPCMLGYDQIARTLASSKSCVKNTIYYDQWISQNISPSTIANYRKFCNDNMQQILDNTVSDADKKALKDKWNQIFKTACENEYKFFEIGLNPSAAYEIVPKGEYIIRNGISGAVLDLDASKNPVTNPMAAASVTTQRWLLEWDETGKKGFTLKNKAANVFLTGSPVTGADVQFKLSTTSATAGDNARFFMTPFYSNENIDAFVPYQVYLTPAQGLVLDIVDGTSDPRTVACLSPNVLTNGKPGWRQVWYFEFMAL
ncbi:hypothetical protein M422DRAFT_243497 [Sphaerobolus stellatus SS14]|nr:hypothetical protein M422DRAFT_243497 [Sphaerobolus stellatus SS14]